MSWYCWLSAQTNWTAQSALIRLSTSGSLLCNSLSNDSFRLISLTAQSLDNFHLQFPKKPSPISHKTPTANPPDFFSQTSGNFSNISQLRNLVKRGSLTNQLFRDFCWPNFGGPKSHRNQTWSRSLPRVGHATSAKTTQVAPTNPTPKPFDSSNWDRNQQMLWMFGLPFGHFLLKTTEFKPKIFRYHLELSNHWLLLLRTLTKTHQCFTSSWNVYPKKSNSFW